MSSATQAKPPGRQCNHVGIYEDKDSLFESLRAGAVSGLLKRTPPTRALEVASAVHNGYSSLAGKMTRYW